MNLAISGMHCGACVARVQSALAPLVDSAAVEVGKAKVAPKAGVGLQAINMALSGVGGYVATLMGGESAPPASRGKPLSVPVREAASSLVTQPNPTAQTTEQANASKTAGLRSWAGTYQPVLLIVAFALGAALLMQARQRQFDAALLMTDFMGGFFVAFAFFKLLNWRGFMNTFAQYDWLGARVGAYAWAYPLIELGLGVCYLLRPTGGFALGLNALTLALMLAGSWGVVNALRSGRTLQCACLGTVFNLPMSRVALIENLSMAAMAAWMLL